MKPQLGQKKGLFSRREQPAQANPFSKELSSIGRRLRMAEDHFTNLNRKTQVTEQNMINNTKKVTMDVKTINSELGEIRKNIEDLKNILRQVIEQLKKTAGKEDVKVLEKYVNLWEPIKFVTSDQVEQIVHEILERKK